MAPSHLEVNESSGFVKFCVEADRASQSTYGINIITTDGTAIGN